MIETAMFVPIFVLLLVGTAEIGRVTYVYFTLHKTLYNIARLVGTRQGANLCDPSDPEILTVKNWAITGSSEGGDPILAGLTADMVQIRVERLEAGSDIMGECECSIQGCDTAVGGGRPDSLVVMIPDGFSVNVVIPYLLTDSIIFRPTVRVPYGGT
jgi:hypothetical protein